MSQAIVTIELRQGTGCMRYHTCSNYLSFLYTLVTSVLMWIYSDPDGTRSVVIKPFTQPEFEPVPQRLAGGQTWLPQASEPL
jgi:hypothetical protein